MMASFSAWMQVRAPASRAMVSARRISLSLEADIVGGEDLERPVTLRDQRGEVGFVIGRIRIGEDQVEGEVDGRPARATRGIVGGGVRERLPLGLRGEGNDGGRAAKRRRTRGGFERVGVHLAHAGHLFDVAMGIDTARRDDEPRGVQQFGPSKIRSHGCDPAVRDGDVGGENGLCRRHPTALDNQIVTHPRDLGAGRPPSPEGSLYAGRAACKTLGRSSERNGMGRAVMIQGTGSNVGKSLLVAGLVRAARRRGINVAPFKPQNMSNNAAVTADGGEIGRAQALQAMAAGLPLHTDMNPVLLKPETDTGAQVIVQGKRLTRSEAGDYGR
jgi:hypothetical protein